MVRKNGTICKTVHKKRKDTVRNEHGNKYYYYTTVNLSILARYHYRYVPVPSCFRDRPVLKFLPLLKFARPPIGR